MLSPHFAYAALTKTIEQALGIYHPASILDRQQDWQTSSRLERHGLFARQFSKQID